MCAENSFRIPNLDHPNIKFTSYGGLWDRATFKRDFDASARKPRASSFQRYPRRLVPTSNLRDTRKNVRWYVPLCGVRLRVPPKRCCTRPAAGRPWPEPRAEKENNSIIFSIYTVFLFASSIHMCALSIMAYAHTNWAILSTTLNFKMR